MYMYKEGYSRIRGSQLHVTSRMDIDIYFVERSIIAFAMRRIYKKMVKTFGAERVSSHVSF